MRQWGIAAVTALGLACASAPALGQDETGALLAKYRAGADACWAASGGAADRIAACDGLVFDACSEGEPGGMTTQGMAQCLYASAAFWDEKLNAVWRELIAAVRAADDYDRADAPDYAVREDKLRDAQRAWIAFRDAQCAYDYSVFGMGSLRFLSFPSCLSEMTRIRVADLIALQGEY